MRKNLRLCFPKKSIIEIKELEKKFYVHFSDLMVEMIKNFSISKNEMLRRYKFKNIELINNEEKKGRAQYYYWVIFQIGRGCLQLEVIC